MMQPSSIKRIGVIGGGQLAWMMAQAAPSLGLELVVQTPHKTDPAVALASQAILAAIDDAQATAQMANYCDCITFENEFVDLAALSTLEAQGTRFYPHLKSLVPLLDKYRQRCYLKELGLPVPTFRALEPTDLPLVAPQFPIVLKARRHGYDGQGTWIIKDQSTLDILTTKLTDPSILLLEEYIPFERELAVIAARSKMGEIAVYPIVETQQVNQVCQRVLVPVDLEPTTRRDIETIARTLLDALDVVGILGIELFLTPQGKIFVNEIAPRTHNSGHFSLDACQTSQFEQQLRAVAGWPLGNPALKPGCVGAVMVNLLGYESAIADYQDQRDRLAAIPHAQVYWYGKSESRPGRKLGHVTVLLPETTPEPLHQTAMAIVQTLEAIWYGAH